MFRELARKLQALSVEPVPFDPSTLDDEVSESTDWTPLQDGGASFQTHRLVLERPNRIVFRATWGGIAFCIAFVVTGLVLITIGLVVAEIPQWVRVLLTLLGLLLTGGMGIHLYFQVSPNFFDVNRGFYVKGRINPQEIPLDTIHALQLISEHCRGSDSSFYSYELNLVLNDGRRINVVDHGNRAQLRADARTISQRLDVPVWDATGSS